MTFATPEPQQFPEVFGVAPIAVGDYQRKLDFSEVVDGELEFSYDVVGRSIAVSWHPTAGGGHFSTFREGATLLRIVDSPESSKLVMEFSTQDTVGNLEVQIFPHVSISERTLIC
ncbi:hypothetical protein [Streptomyces bambusae]|uniref:Uncharacterized protein n=1 Tax=Streptomyces bambusae TaxID=1550616 RepID=A0ABS6Z503_9ACTN|nr:hypothetical protein [Streptomyces bambusae]MBW5481790.1 hypothetical protein [Streptomyces bambusae]